MKSKKLGVIILAAGAGKRMNSKKANKVTILLANKPLILHSIQLLEKMNFAQIIVVVGFAKESVKNALKGSRVLFAEQKKRLGTAHAVKSALSRLNASTTDVLVIQGDDSHFYKKEMISKLIDVHFSENANITFLTINASSPFGLGRIERDKKGRVTAIVEEKDAMGYTRKIREVNPACYIFTVSFLKKYLGSVQKSPVTGEYYLTSLIDICSVHRDTGLDPSGNVPRPHAAAIHDNFCPHFGVFCRDAAHSSCGCPDSGHPAVFQHLHAPGAGAADQGLGGIHGIGAAILGEPHGTFEVGGLEQWPPIPRLGTGQYIHRQSERSGHGGAPLQLLESG